MIPLFLLPFFPHSLLLPIRFLLLTWNPPCCDRIRPPRSQVARKLDSQSPSPCSYTPHSRIPTPWGFSHPNIHSLGRHREPGSQDPAHYPLGLFPFLGLLSLSSASLYLSPAFCLSPCVFPLCLFTVHYFLFLPVPAMCISLCLSPLYLTFFVYPFSLSPLLPLSLPAYHTASSLDSLLYNTAVSHNKISTA